MEINKFDLNKIKYFCSVIRTGSIKQAAEELYLTSSAISQAITSLENNLDVKLFTRIGKKLIPTEAAYQFFEACSHYQNNLEQAIFSLSKSEKAIEGQIRIATFTEFAKSQLILFIDKIQQKHPKLTVKLLFGSPSYIDEQFEEGKVDFTFSIYPFDKSKNCLSNKIIKEELIFVGHNSLKIDNMSLESILKLPIIDYYSKHQLMNRWIQFHYGKNIKHIPIKIYAATTEMVSQFIELKSGFGVIPKYIFDDLKSKNNLSIIRPTENNLYDYIWFNERVAYEQNQAQKTFSKLVKEYLAEKNSDMYLDQKSF